jgi:hypothetical protein
MALFCRRKPPGPDMPTPILEIVREALAKNGRDALCRRAVDEAWTALNDGYPGKVWWRRRSTRAAIMWEHSIDNVVGALADDKDVRVVRHYDTTSIILDEKVLLRCKKASIQLFTANYLTPLACAFHQHNGDLFGFAGLQRVELAHVFNRFETDLDWIGIVAREKRKILWHFELGRPEGQGIIELPPKKPIAPAGDRVLRPIMPNEKDRGEKGE